MTGALGRGQRRRLRELLVATEPWLDRPDLGPRAVDAGECDRCDRHPRLVTTCGPGGASLCAACVTELGRSAWCDGHVDEAEDAVRWVRSLPDHWAAAARLWWVATGEVALDPSLVTSTPRLAELLTQAEVHG